MPNNATEKIKLVPKKSFDIKIIGLLLVIFLGTVFVVHTKSTTVDCTDEYRQDTIMQTPSGHEIAIEITDSPASQTKGLSGRACIDDNWGMIFNFEDESYRYFWMKDMNFPIDIVWINGDKKVIDITKDLNPNTYPKTFTSILPSQHVLELPAGKADEFGFTPSAQVNF